MKRDKWKITSICLWKTEESQASVFHKQMPESTEGCQSSHDGTTVDSLSFFLRQVEKIRTAPSAQSILVLFHCKFSFQYFTLFSVQTFPLPKIWACQLTTTCHRKSFLFPYGESLSATAVSVLTGTHVSLGPPTSQTSSFPALHVLSCGLLSPSPCCHLPY